MSNSITKRNQLEIQVAAQIMAGLLASGDYTKPDSVSLRPLEDALWLTRVLFETMTPNGEMATWAWPKCPARRRTKGQSVSA